MNTLLVDKLNALIRVPMRPRPTYDQFPDCRDCPGCWSDGGVMENCPTVSELTAAREEVARGKIA